MKSVDTNILVYGTNTGCTEYKAARAILDAMASAPHDWILADQVLYEYYRVVRSPSVLERPLSAQAAAQRVAFFREQLGCLHCGYNVDLYDAIIARLRNKTFRAGNTFDLLLAATLHHHGVTTFYTHNAKDFRGYGLFEVVDPIAGG